MKILFVVSGIGYGDAIREHVNIVALKKKFPQAHVMVAGYDNSYHYFHDKYPTVRISGYKLPGTSLRVSAVRFGLRNLFLPAFWVLGTLKARLRAFNFTPDIVVSDFEPLGISLARVLFKKCVVVFGYDPLLYKAYSKKHKVSYKMKIEAAYFEKLYDQADLVVIPTFFRPQERHLGYNYIDPVLRVYLDDLPSENVLMKKFHLKRKPVLVMLGGSDFGTTLAKHINAIAPSIDEDFIIFGGNLDMLCAKNVRYFPYNADFLKYLKVCKGVITLAGHNTLSESLVYKKPVLCFPIQDHIEQILNAYALEDVIMVSHDSSYKHVQKVLPEFLRNISNIKKKVERLNVKGNGAEQVVKFIGLALKK